ncbi:MAG: hypothetical protein ACRDHW_04010 [Ktedonobacteraceae bacterium]
MILLLILAGFAAGVAMMFLSAALITLLRVESREKCASCNKVLRHESMQQWIDEQRYCAKCFYRQLPPGSAYASAE